MRVEYKYLIPVSSLQKIKNRMIPFLVLDKYALKNEVREYTVRSLYFDTPQLQYYFEKIEGAKNRKKIRIRVYDDYAAGKIAFLEIKRKDGDFVSKFRAPMLYQDLEKLFETRDLKDLIICNGFKNAVENAKMFLFYMIRDKLRPTSLVTYDREAFMGKFNESLRITFDKNLRFLSSPNYNNLFEEEKLETVLKNKVIVEIKFSHSIPNWLRDVIIEFGLLRVSVSKYAVCIDGNNRTHKFKKLALSNLDLSRPSEQNDELKQNVS